jgi:hypothetical protein
MHTDSRAELKEIHAKETRAYCPELSQPSGFIETSTTQSKSSHQAFTFISFQDLTDGNVWFPFRSGSIVEMQ